MTRFTRRSLLALPAALALAPVLAPVAARAAKLNDDGMHTEDWFLDSFLELNQDIADAAAKGKRVAVVFEQRGCIYCAEMHEKQLADTAIAGYIRQHFERSEEHTSELQSLMRISYAVLCLKKKK